MRALIERAAFRQSPVTPVSAFEVFAVLTLLAHSKEPIWHSVSCACRECLDADETWITRYSYSLQFGKRPLFTSTPQ